MAIETHPVEYKGQTYESLKSFANALGLPYTKVVRHYRKGRTPEEIVELCQFTTASKAKEAPKEGAKRCYVEYEGMKYTSIYAAADALGLAASRIYDIRKRKGLTAAEAIDYVLKKKQASSDTGTSPNSKPCTVEGVTYPSREAAINAYHQTRITVYSRMEREHISFEEALIRGRNSATYRPPAVSLFPSLHLISTRKPVTQPVLAELARSLEYYRCRVQPMVDLVTGLSVLLVNEHSYVYFNHEARGLEVLSELPIEADRDTLWALNGSYVAAKLFTNHLSGKIYLLSFQSAKEEEQDIKTLLNTWFSHICIRDKLLRMFEEEEQ